MFYIDSTIRFSDKKGLGESYYILCPVCWNSSIKLTSWEHGTTDEEECAVCKRMEKIINNE